MKNIVFMALMFGIACLVLLTGLVLPLVVALLVLLVAITADFYTTWRCLKIGGIEQNPVVAFLFRRIGLSKTFGLMVILWVCYIVFVWTPQAGNVQTAVAFVYWVVPLNNVIVLRKMSKMRARVKVEV